MRRITGTALEYMITVAIANHLQTDFITYALPLIAVSIAMVLANLYGSFVLGRRWLEANWFETGVGLLASALRSPIPD